jgi:quercetin dioxygenase-like cupin family protein
MAAGPYGRTSGTDERESRAVMEPLMAFSLDDEIERLHDEEQWRAGQRNARTLAKDVDFRVVLTVLRGGQTVGENDGDARASLHVLHGEAVLRRGSDEAQLAAGDVAVVDAGEGWTLTAESECAFLLTLAWPREKAQV